DRRVDFLENAWVLGDAKRSKLLGPVVLVQGVRGVFLELFHVCANKHLAELDKVTVVFIVNLNDTPWVTTSANLASIWPSDLSVGTNNCERNLRHDLLVLSNGFL